MRNENWLTNTAVRSLGKVRSWLAEFIYTSLYV